MKVGEVYALLGMDFSQFGKDERTAKRRTESLGRNLSGIIKNAFSFTLGMGFFQAVQVGFRSTVGTMIGFNSQMEQAQIGFTTMLGSGQRAKRFLDDVATFAAKTPFEFPELLDASKRMLAYGFAAEDVLPTMEAIGNATAAVGLGAQGINRIILALGQMRAKGKVSGEEMRQLTETGIPAWEILAEAMGKSTAEVMDLSQRGLIPADRAIKMFTEGMNKRFPGMMSKMENTWEGVTSTIKDVWRMTIGEVTKGLFRGAVTWLQKVRDTATGFYDAFRAGGLQYAIEQTFGAGVAASVNTLAAALKGLWGIVSGAGKTIVKYWSTIGPLTAWVVKSFLAFKAASLVVGIAAAAVRTFTVANLAMRGSLVATSPGILKLVSDIVVYYKCLIPATVGTFSFSTALTYLKAAALAVQTALGTLIWPILLIGAVLMGGVSLWNKYSQAVQSAAQKAQMDKMTQQQNDYIASANEAAQGTEAQADALAEMGKAASKNVQSFDEVHTLMEDIADTTAGVPQLDTGLVPQIPEIEPPALDLSFDMEAAIAEARSDMGGFWGWLADEAGKAWDGVKGKWENFKAWVAGKWTTFKTWAGNTWHSIVDWVAQKWGNLTAWIAPRWEAFKTWAGTKWATFKTWAGETWIGITGWIGEKWGLLSGWVAPKWEAFRTWISTKWTAFRAWAGETWHGITSWVGEKWGLLSAWVSPKWENFKAWVAGKWTTFRTWAGETWIGITGWIGEKWGLLSGWVAPKWEGFRVWVGGKWEAFKTWAGETWGRKDGITGWIGEQWANLRDWVSPKWDTFKSWIGGKWTAFRAWAGETWGRKNGITGAIADTWDGMKAAIEDKWSGIKAAISERWSDLKSTVSGWISSAVEWGKNLVSNIARGIQSGRSDVESAAGGVADTVAGFMAYESPAEKGPGRYADQWAPNLMRMYAKGILANVSMVQSAAGEVARSLAAMATVPANAFAGMASAMPVRQDGSAAAGGAPAPEIHLHIGTLVADRQGLRQLERMLSDIRISEMQRTGR